MKKRKFLIIKNRILSAFICAIMCFFALNTESIFVKASSMTAPVLKDKTYTVNSASNLRWISGVCSGKVKKGSTNYPSDPTFKGYTIILKNSLSVSVVTEKRREYVLESGEPWTPIGTQENPFSGTFDGGEYKIEDIFVTGGEGDYNGFFGNVKDGNIKNLTVSGYVGGKNHVGGIAGALNNGEISGCIFSGRVDGGKYVGGIVGSATLESRVYLCVSACEINTHSGECAGGVVGLASYSKVESCSGGVFLYSNSQYSAGVVGYAQGDVTVNCCSSDGDIIADGETPVAGGILGASEQNVVLTNNSFGGMVYCSGKNSSFSGGISGRATGKIENSYVNGGVHAAVYFDENPDETENKKCVSAGIVADTTAITLNNCYFSGISETNGEKGLDVCPDNKENQINNTFYANGIAYYLYNTDELYHVAALLDELSAWVKGKSGYSLWQCVWGINETKPILKHTNAAGSDGEHAWKIEGTSFTFYIDGEMSDYSENEYGIAETPWIPYQLTIKSVNIKEGVTRIGDNAFWGFEKITTLKLPSTLTSVGEYSFEQCKALKNFTFPPNVSDIGEGAFRGCKALTKISIPLGIRAIRNYTFSQCSKLESVIIPESVSFIGYKAFALCDGLVNLTLPQSVREIDNYAFYWCEKLYSVKLPVTLNRIGECAFGRCDALIDIEIPKGVKMDKDVFWSTLPKGDVDSDGRYTTFDYLKIKAHFLGTSPLDKAQIKAADADFDGIITVTDYLNVKMLIRGLK